MSPKRMKVSCEIPLPQLLRCVRNSVNFVFVVIIGPGVNIKVIISKADRAFLHERSEFEFWWRLYLFAFELVSLRSILANEKTLYFKKLAGASACPDETELLLSVHVPTLFHVHQKILKQIFSPVSNEVSNIWVRWLHTKVFFYELAAYSNATINIKNIFEEYSRKCFHWIFGWLQAAKITNHLVSWLIFNSAALRN